MPAKYLARRASLSEGSRGCACSDSWQSLEDETEDDAEEAEEESVTDADTTNPDSDDNVAEVQISGSDLWDGGCGGGPLVMTAQQRK